MKIGDWRTRLQAAIDKDPRSDSAISKSAGMGRTYIHGILKEGKDPGIKGLSALCETLGVTLSQVLYGIEISPETEEILSLIENNPNARDGILKLLSRDKAA